MAKQQSSVGCAWEVRAGDAPGVELPEYFMKWPLSGKDCKTLEKFIDAQSFAETYARRLQLLSVLKLIKIKWTRVDFVWS